MTAHEELLRQTATERDGFMRLPLIQEVIHYGADRELYLDFLGQAYHHVRCTAPLLALAAARCGPQDRRYQTALFDYIDEERGHEEWILDDIEALGGDRAVVKAASPRFPCRIMVGHAHSLVDHVSPYALLGMVHVLEGMAVALAGSAVTALRKSIATTGDAGFKYLTTHGEIDVKHTQFFEDLINDIEGRHFVPVAEAARDFYTLYGDIFREIDVRRGPRQRLA